MGRSRTFKVDMALYTEAKAQLDELGFSAGAVPDGQVDDLPRPKLSLEADLQGFEGIAARTGAYANDLERFAREYAKAEIRLGEVEMGERSSGRPSNLLWRDGDYKVRRRINAIVAPIGEGYYDVPWGTVARPYHFAEMAYIAHQSNPDALTLTTGKGTFLAWNHEFTFGVDAHQPVRADGTRLPARMEFDLDRFWHAWRSAGQSVPEHLPTWKAIAHFLSTVEVPDALKQALCHCRYLLLDEVEGAKTWTKEMVTIKPSRTSQHLKTPLKEKLLIVEAALYKTQLFMEPPIVIARMLCPAVISWAEYQARFGNIRKEKPKKFFKVTVDKFVAQLKQLQEEIELEIANDSGEGDS